MRIELASKKAELAKGNIHVRRQIASDAGVSERNVQKYMQIKKKGSPELLEKVQTGELKIGTAHRELEVTVTTVKEVYAAKDSDDDYQTGRIVLSYIKHLNGLYSNLDERQLTSGVAARLKAQAERLGKLIKDLCNYCHT